MISRTSALIATAAALSLLVAAACSSHVKRPSAGPTSATADCAAAACSSNANGPSGGPTSATADCNSVTTCYTPQQLEVAYDVQPLLQRGIDGRGETVVLPELAESQLSPPLVTDLRQDFAAFDRLFHLPAPRLKVVSTFPFVLNKYATPALIAPVSS